MTKDRRWLWILLGLLGLLLLFFLLNYTIIKTEDSAWHEPINIESLNLAYTSDGQDSLTKTLDFDNSSWKIFRKSKAKYNSIITATCNKSCYSNEPMEFENGIFNLFEILHLNTSKYEVEIRDTIDPTIRLQQNTFELGSNASYNGTNLIVEGNQCYGSNDIKILNQGYHTKMIENFNIQSLPVFEGKKYIGLHPKPLPCDVSPEVGGAIPRTIVHENCNCNELRIAGTFMNIADQIDIYCGTTSDLLLSTGMMSDSFNYQIPLSSCSSNDISIKITPSTDDNTLWRYKLICND